MQELSRCHGANCFLPNMRRTVTAQNLEADFFRRTAGETVLNLGSGQTKQISLTQWVHIDIDPHKNCTVVGDAHALPFGDNSFAGVYTTAVFEHLRQPWVAAGEVARVLKPGGLLWCTVPFSYPVHGRADYFRYTADGLYSLFSSLEPVACGPEWGPIWGISHFARQTARAVAIGSRPLRFALMWITAWMFHFFIKLDPWLVRRDPRCASAFYLLARKP